MTLVAVLIQEKCILLWRFHTLRNDELLEAFTHVDHGADNDGIVRVAGYMAHERLVNLQGIDMRRSIPQSSFCRMPGDCKHMHQIRRIPDICFATPGTTDKADPPRCCPPSMLHLLTGHGMGLYAACLLSHSVTCICFVRHGETDWNVEKRIQGLHGYSAQRYGQGTGAAGRDGCAGSAGVFDLASQ